MPETTINEHLDSYIRGASGRDLSSIESLITEFRNGNACADRHMKFISNIIEYAESELSSASLAHVTALLQILEQSGIAGINIEIRTSIYRALKLITLSNQTLIPQEIAIGCFLLSLPNSPSGRICEILLPRAAKLYKDKSTWAVWQLLAYIAASKSVATYLARDAISDLVQLSTNIDFALKLRSRNSLLQRLGTDHIDIEAYMSNLRPADPVRLAGLTNFIDDQARQYWRPNSEVRTGRTLRRQNA